VLGEFGFNARHDPVLGAFVHEGRQVIDAFLLDIGVVHLASILLDEVGGVRGCLHSDG